MSLNKIFVNTQDTGFEGIPLQEIGQSTTVAMSQKAVTDELIYIRNNVGLLVFQSRDFGGTEWVITNTRAEAEIASSELEKYDYFIVTPNSGYLIAPIGYNAQDLSTGVHVFRTYLTTSVDYTTLSGYNYYGIMIKKSD